MDERCRASLEGPTPQGDAPRPATGIGVLLIHGISSTPASLGPWAESLERTASEVRVPLLPGHGTQWQDLRGIRHTSWTAHVRQELLDLASRHRTVVVGGLSMGGALALSLAEDPRTRASVAGLMLVNPAVALRPLQSLAVPVLHRLLPSIPAIASDIAKPGVVEEAYERVPTPAVEQLRRLQRTVRRDLAAVRCPVLLATSPDDHVVAPRCSDLVAARVRGPVERVALRRSFHVATLDHDAPVIGERSRRFVARLAAS